MIVLILFYLFGHISSESSVQISLNSILAGVHLRSNDVTFNFKNLSVHDGKVEFDELIINGNGNSIQETVEQLPTDSYFDYPELVAAIDETISPCDDFYGHVCQKWIDEKVIAKDEISVGHMDLLSQRVHSQLQEILEENYTSDRSREQLMVHEFYKKCMLHKKEPDNKAFRVLLKQLINCRENRNTTDLTNWMIEFRPMNFLVDVSVGINEYNSSLRILQIMPGTSVLSYNAYTKKEYQHEYLAMRQFLGELLDLLQLDDSDGLVFGGKAREFENRIDAFFEVDRKIAVLNQANQFNKSTSMVKFSSLNKLVTNVDWKPYFESFVPSNMLNNILNNTFIQVIDEESLQKIDELISSVNATNLQYYLDWQAVLYFGEFFDSRYQEVMQSYNMAVSGATTQSGEKDCMSTMSSIFYDIVAQLYVEKFFPNTTRNEVNKMIDNIIISFEQMLQSNSWMDVVTKNQALEKLNAIQKFVGFNDHIFNNTWISNKYKDLKFSANDTYYTHMLKIQQWTQTVVLARLNVTRAIEEFEFPSTDVNAFYDPTTNSIALTAAILQSPYFNTSLPSYINYGAIGAAIGHEITHGFDNSGAEYDKRGNRKNWWDSNTLMTFMNRSKCFIDQYSNITVDGTDLKIDGRLTLNENIADNGGIRAALNALKQLPNQSNQKIRGLEKKTPLQMFFMANAYVWCSKTRHQQVLSRLYSDSHSPEKWRINTVFSNQKEFSAAFNCPVGSNLNPMKKCEVW